MGFLEPTGTMVEKRVKETRYRGKSFQFVALSRHGQRGHKPRTAMSLNRNIGREDFQLSRSLCAFFSLEALISWNDLHPGCERMPNCLNETNLWTPAPHRAISSPSKLNYVLLPLGVPTFSAFPLLAPSFFVYISLDPDPPSTQKQEKKTLANMGIPVHLELSVPPFMKVLKLCLYFLAQTSLWSLWANTYSPTKSGTKLRQRGVSNPRMTSTFPFELILISW